MKRLNALIMGAAGRDFHNFNVFFRNNRNYNVVAFTQAPGQNIGELSKLPTRKYPKELSGKLYPRGIPIYPEEELVGLIKKFKINQVVLSYSDLSHLEVMHKASIANSAGADFVLLGYDSTTLKSKKPVISICAVRTGSGKSPTSRKVCEILKKLGFRVVVIRHPMPYGLLKDEVCERFETFSDLDRYKCTIEEREEYEPHIEQGTVVYAGVDYEKILRAAEKEADIIVWDGGNNDLPFYKSDLHIVVADPLRAGHELAYYPGEANARLADIVIINKINSATAEQIKTVEENIKKLNPKAKIIKAKSELFVEHPDKIKGKNVLVIEDGPTVTHGGMGYGAGHVAAEKFGAKEIINPRPFAVGSIKKVYPEYPHLKDVLPAMGYGKEQTKELEETINKSNCEEVISGTPIDLNRVLKSKKEIIRVRYGIKEVSDLTLEKVLRDFLAHLSIAKRPGNKKPNKK